MRAVLLAAAMCANSATAIGQAAPALSRPSAPDIERRVDSLLSQMTLEEKISRLAGGWTGFDMPGLPRLGIPTLYAADSPFGVRADGPSTLYGGGINLAASWNPDLAREVGLQVGRDARARNRQYSLGPGLNMYRSPLSGRNFEYYGEDPFLASRIVVGFVNGVQSQGVSSTVKHFAGNNSEFARDMTDSRIDERALREIYLPAFEAAVKEAHTGAIMISYNMLNGDYMAQNRRMITDLLKNEWGFDGVVMSDWYATHDAVASANAGMDIEMPNPLYFNRDSLLPAIRAGRISQATIDDKVRRLLRTAIRFGWLTRAQSDTAAPTFNVRGREVALRSAREGIVLLKNDNALLPLEAQRVRTIAVLGPNAYPAVVLGGGSATIPTYDAVSILEGVAHEAGPDVNVQHVRGIPSLGRAAVLTNFLTSPNSPRAQGIKLEVFYNADLKGAPALTRTERRLNLGAPLDMTVPVRDDAELAERPPLGPNGPVSTRWTGYYVVEPQRAGVFDFVVQMGGFSGGGYRLLVDGRVVADRWRLARAVAEGIAVPLAAGEHKVVLENHSQIGWQSPFVRMSIVARREWVDSVAVNRARNADIAIVAVGFDPQTETEGWDRTFSLPPGQDELIKAVAAANPRTIVLINSGGAVDMSGWIDRVPAVVQAWYPGQEAGTAIADILYGVVNPSGHLPATFEKRWEDNPSASSYYPDSGTNKIVYREGVFVGYRGFDQRSIMPRFPFGHGLSYTTFTYGDLRIEPDTNAPQDSPRWTVSFDVTNSGRRAGAAVAQLYVHERAPAVPRPPKELKGFAKIMLQRGETQRVTLPLGGRSLAYFDTTAKAWKARAGIFDILVGNSSADADLGLSAPLVLNRTLTISTRE